MALVTGAARRIGAAFARALAEDGWSVILHCNRSVEEARALSAELSSLRGLPMPVVAVDLESADAGEAVLAACPSAPSLLVNNASLFEEDQLASFPVEQWDRQIAVNLRAPALLIQAFARSLDAGASGHIVNLLDAKLSALNPDYFSYTVSKIGLAGVTELAARALAPRIRVNAIAPTVTLVSGPQGRANFAQAQTMNALGRGVDVGDLVGALRYLIATPTVTGQTLTIDSGQRFLSLPRDVAYMVQT